MKQYKCERCSKEYLKEGRAYNIDDYHYIVCQECERLFEKIYDQLADDFINDRLPYDNLTKRLIDQYAPVLEKLSKE